MFTIQRHADEKNAGARQTGLYPQSFEEGSAGFFCLGRYGMIADEETGQNKAILNRIIPVNSLMINGERRETG